MLLALYPVDGVPDRCSGGRRFEPQTGPLRSTEGVKITDGNLLPQYPASVVLHINHIIGHVIMAVAVLACLTGTCCTQD